MAIGVFPVAKLGVLLVKQISKPIANIVKESAKKHPFFRRHVCMPPAQFYHWCEVKMKMWVMNLGKPVEIPKLNEAMAIELGANLLGETIIFSIAAALLALEYSRQVRKEAAKEAARVQEITDINDNIQNLFFKAEKQEAELRQIMRAMAALETKLDKFVHRPYGPPKPDSGTPMSPSTRTEPSATGNKDDSGLVLRSTRYENRSGLLFSALDYVTFCVPYGECS